MMHEAEQAETGSLLEMDLQSEVAHDFLEPKSSVRRFCFAAASLALVCRIGAGVMFRRSNDVSSTDSSTISLVARAGSCDGDCSCAEQLTCPYNLPPGDCCALQCCTAYWASCSCDCSWADNTTCNADPVSLGNCCYMQCCRPIVHTSLGAIRGVAGEGYRAFKGIPFAVPPLGTRRWTPPALPEPWAPEIWDATRFRSACLQWPYELYGVHGHEDCLYLNVFTPTKATRSSRFPVLFWVHGGGYINGGAQNYDGGKVAALTGDLVVVTTNYRLNVFGFLAGNALRSRDPAHSTGAYGLMDQRAAMRWVQDHIESFGGDPARVLLVGESAGGASVINHLVRPASFGLFSRAACMSGGYSLALPYGPELDETAFEARFQSVLNVTGCEDVACLERLPADSLLNLSSSWCFEPVMDGVDLPAPLAELLQSPSRVAPNVRLLIGSTAEDCASCVDGIFGSVPAINCTAGDFEHCTVEDFALHATNVKAEYYRQLDIREAIRIYGSVSRRPNCNNSEWYWAARLFSSDATQICPSRQTALWAASAGLPTYRYSFEVRPEWAGCSGAYHSLDVNFLFLSEDGAIAEAMVAYWRNFASSGNPNINAADATPTDLPEWPAGVNSIMIFGDAGFNATSSGDHGREVSACNYWDAAMFQDSVEPPWNHEDSVTWHDVYGPASLW